MSECTKSLGQDCPGLFACQVPRLELQLVDHNDGGGDAVDYYCLNAFNPHQMALFHQFLDSVKALSPLAPSGGRPAVAARAVGCTVGRMPEGSDVSFPTQSAL